MKLQQIFKQTLNESDWQEEHNRLTIQAMKDWCQKMRLRDIRVSKEGNEFVLNCSGNVRIIADDLDYDDDNMVFLPYKFGEVEGDFSIAAGKFTKMRNLKNCPYMVYGNFKAAGLWLESLEGGPGSVSNIFDVSDNQLTNWDGFPSQVGEINAVGNKITSFKGIAYNVTMCNTVIADAQCRSGVLELFKIEGLEQVSFKARQPSQITNELAIEIEKAYHIINKHLQGDRDIIDVQSDFIDADLSDWVKR